MCNFDRFFMKIGEIIFVKFGLILALVLVVLFLCMKIAKPFSETMVCGSDYVCSVDQKYLWKTEKSKIRLNSYSYLDCDVSEITQDIRGRTYHTRGWDYVVRLNIIDNTYYRNKPFVYPIKLVTVKNKLLNSYAMTEDDRIFAEQECYDYSGKLSADFKNYMKNPKDVFFVSSQTGGLKSSVLESIGCSLLLCVFAFLLWVFW